MKIPDSSKLVFQSHYVNASEVAIRVADVVNIYYVDDEAKLYMRRPIFQAEITSEKMTYGKWHPYETCGLIESGLFKAPEIRPHRLVIVSALDGRSIITSRIETVFHEVRVPDEG